MATYYVDGVNGTDGAGVSGATGSPWRTISYALGRVATSGDTIKVRTATYYETFNITKSVVVENDTGHSPIIDGRYTPALRGNQSYKTYTGSTITANSMPSATTENKNTGNWVISGCQLPIIRMTGTNAVLRGFAIRHVAGKALHQGGTGNTAENLRIDFTYAGAILMDGTNGIIRNTTITRASMKFFDPSRFLCPCDCKDTGCNPYCGGGPEAVQTAVVVKGKNNFLSGMKIALNCAEGLCFDKDGVGGTLIDSVLHSNLHWNLGVNGHDNARFERVIAYYCFNALQQYGKTKMPTIITLGDENPAHMTKQGPTIINCLFIGGDTALNIGNGRRPGETNWPRPFSLQKAYIGYSTFISIPQSARVARFGMDYIYTHANSVIENCIFWKNPQTPAMYASQDGWGNKVTFRNNVWNTSPAAPFNGGAIVTSDQVMNNPAATLTVTGFELFASAMPNPDSTNFNIANYDLVQGSPAIGRASDRSNTNGLTLPSVTLDIHRAGRTDFGGGRYYDVGSDEFQGVVGNAVYASGTLAPTSGNPPLTVQFTSTSSASGSAVINDYLWTFGDGTTSTQQNPTKVYSVAGTYTPTLRVRDTVRDLTSTVTLPEVAVAGNSVTASFTATPTSGNSPLTVNFTSTSSVSGSAVINDYLWTFGDGTTSTQQNPTKVYSGVGVYTPTLRVRDTVRNLTSTAVGEDVEVVGTDASITAAFSRTPGNGVAPLTVNFTNESVATGTASITGYLWDFGDGTTSTQQNPTKVYSTPGTYQVTLRVVDAGRSLESTSATKTVTVLPTGALVASFGQDSTGGAGPLVVNFTNTSVATGTILSSVWDFGDGNTITLSGKQDAIHVYGRPGIFLPKLRINGEDSKYDDQTGDPIIVTAQVASKAFDVVWQKVTTSNTITWDLDGAVPSLIMVWVCGATRVNDAVYDGDAAFLSAAFATSTGDQIASTTKSFDGYTPSASRNSTRGGLLAYEPRPPQSSVDPGKIRLVSIGPNTAEFIIDSAFTNPNFYMVAAAFTTARGGIVHKQVIDGALVSPGFVPDAVFVQTSEAIKIDIDDPAADDLGGSYIAGFATRDAQYSYAHLDRNAVNPTSVGSRIVSGSVFASNLISGLRARISDWDTGRLTLTGGAKAGYITLAGMKFPEGSDVDLRLLQTPTSAVDPQIINLGWEPDGLIVLASVNDTIDAFDTSSDAEGFTIGVSDKDQFYGIGVSSKPGLSVSDTHTHLDTQLRVYFGRNALALEANVSVTETGYRFDWTMVRPEPKYMIVMAFKSVEVNPVLPVVEFSASPTTSRSGVVQFTNLSTGADSFLWDFGDSAVSGEENPKHVYEEAGTYTVSLTAANGGGAVTETKVGYITVTRGSQPGYAGIGPFVPVTATNYTENDLHDTLADPLAGRLEMAIDLDVAYIDANPVIDIVSAALAGPKAGKVAIYVDVARDGFVIQYPPGITGPGGESQRFLPFSTSGVEANFTRSVGSGTAPLTVNFTSTSTVSGFATIDDYLWNFGDGTTSTQQNPTKVYSTPGNYTPTLRVRDLDLNLTSTKTGAPILVSAPPAEEQTATFQVTNGADDGREDWQGAVALGASSVVLSAPTYTGAVRFLDVTIPKDSTIVSARLELYVAARTTPEGIIVRAQAHNNAPALAETTDNLTARTTTSNYVALTGTGIGTGWKEFTGFAAVVNEVTSRAGWTSGNAMAFLFDAGTVTDFDWRTADFTTNPALAAKLVVTYIPPA